MKLTYFASDPPNFGDELNRTIWSALLPQGFLDDDSSELFLGIGSILSPKYPVDARKIVMGSGYGGYTKIPDVHDGTWDIRFVRGPQTAEMLGLDPTFAITDAAVLLRETDLPDPTAGIGVAFMPHYESVERGAWREVCRAADVYFIDPTQTSDRVIAELSGAELVITEAMHGAIVADALRTPWIGVRTMHHVHRFKWYDWTRSLGIKYRPRRLFPSNSRESWALATGRSGCGPRARAVLGGALATPANLALKHAAVHSLQSLAGLEPQLSSDNSIDRATDQAMGALNCFIRDHAMSIALV